MPIHLPPHFKIHPEVAQALQSGRPVVALESTVITHGLPQPENLALAQNMETEVRSAGAVPATVAVLDRAIQVGLTAGQLQALATADSPRKISVRDFSPALVQNAPGGTTVAGTMFAAHKTGIQVFATGGIGGVHHDPPYDISADLPQLASIPMVVVCAGAKAILDLPGTLEYLETSGVPVLGYQTDEFPAFYSPSSGLPVSARADSPEEVAAIARTHWELGHKSAILVTVPLPAGAALQAHAADTAIQQALQEAAENGLRGQAVTPYLLSRVSELTGGASLEANLELLHNNARTAAQIAVALAVPRQYTA